MTIRIGLLGCGGIAALHLRGYRVHADRFTVAAVADVNPAATARCAADLGAEPYGDALTLIAQAGVDAVDICLPHHLHAPAIVAAARAGSHILCEKPLCLTLEEARIVRAAVADAGVTLMCAHNQLFLPAVTRVRTLLDEGVIGRVYEVRTTDCFVNPFSRETMGWRADAATSGGGELIDTGYHPAYLLLHLARGVPVEVAAMLATHRLAFMQGEDSAHLLVRFDNGVLGQVATSWAYEPPSTTGRFSVVGERGTIVGTVDSLRIEHHTGSSEGATFAPVDTFTAEIADFADCVERGRRPLHTEVEGTTVLAMILAAYESARTGTIAPVPGL